MLLSKIYDLKALYRESDFSFTFTTDLFSLKTSATLLCQLCTTITCTDTSFSIFGG